MKQQIEIRSVIRKDEKVLFLKRSSDQKNYPGKYELPFTTIEYNEQPEQAVFRSVKTSIGLEVSTSHLSDTFTYVDQERNLQLIIIVYKAGVPEGKAEIKLASGYSKYVWKKPSDMPQDDLTDLTYILLASDSGEQGNPKGSSYLATQTEAVDSGASASNVMIYSDGGSRGNPGPSAAGYVVQDKDGKLIYEGGSYLGITTNNQAEYHGIRLGLEKARELGMKSANCYLDSMLVVNQLNGQYAIRNRELWPIHERVEELIKQFDRVSFRHVKREHNRQADNMVNKILDSHVQKETLKL